MQVLVLVGGGSDRTGYGPDAGAAHGHRPVRGSVAAAAVVPGQNQEGLVDRDRVEAVGVLLSGPEAGTEVAGALGLPDGGRDPVRHRGRPAEGTYGQSLQLTDVKTDGKQLQTAANSCKQSANSFHR